MMVKGKENKKRQREQERMEKRATHSEFKLNQMHYERNEDEM